MFAQYSLRQQYDKKTRKLLIQFICNPLRSRSFKIERIKKVSIQQIVLKVALLYVLKKLGTSFYEKKNNEILKVTQSRRETKQKIKTPKNLK